MSCNLRGPNPTVKLLSMVAGQCWSNLADYQVLTALTVDNQSYGKRMEHNLSAKRPSVVALAPHVRPNTVSISRYGTVVGSTAVGTTGTVLTVNLPAVPYYTVHTI
jgi:hypothetical protein